MDHSYPFTIEEDLAEYHTIPRNVYFVANLISDLLNYVVFVFVNLSIDIYMLVKLRRTLNEKLKRFAEWSTDNKHMCQKSVEIRESMNNAIRMVIVNSTLNFILKLPQTLVSLENAAEAFYYQSKYYRKCGIYCNYSFYRFSFELRYSGVFYFISDLSDWLFTILISIQLFVYSKFDRQIKAGLERLIDLIRKKDNNNVTNDLINRNDE